METLRNVNEVSLNFNLREPRKVNGSTNVYAVVKVEGKQIKLPINCKVNAWQWDSKKQTPKITNNMTQKDIADAMQLNCVLNDVRMNFYSYICSGETITIEGIKQHLTTNTEDMANKNAQPPKTRRQATATKLLNEAFLNLYGTLQKRPYSVYREGFLKFLALGYYDGKKLYDSVSMLNYEGLTLYKRYLEKETKNDGVVIAQKLNIIVRLINELAKAKKYGIEKLESYKAPKRAQHEDDIKKRPLTQKEKETFLNFDFANLAESAKGKREKTKYEKYVVYQDVFNMMLSSGVRFSDVLKLFNGEYKAIEQNGMKMYVLLAQKEEKKGLRAYIFATPSIKELQQKYASGLPFEVKEETLNVKLKEMFEMCGFTAITEKWTEYEGETPKYMQGALCDIISTHFARYTFSTERAAEGWSEEYVDRMTSHATLNKSMTSRYTHLTDEQITNILTKEYKRIHNQGNETTEHNESVNALIAECKDVLMFLGADYKDIADVSDIDTLMYKVYFEYYQPFAQWGIDVKQIKDIYNTKATFEEKTFALKELLRECEEMEVTKA